MNKSNFCIEIYQSNKVKQNKTKLLRRITKENKGNRKLEINVFLNTWMDLMAGLLSCFNRSSISCSWRSEGLLFPGKVPTTIGMTIPRIRKNMILLSIIA